MQAGWRSWFGITLVATLTALACGELETSDADRCESHADCNPGRMCQARECVPIARPADGGLDGGIPGVRDSDASVPGPKAPEPNVQRPSDGGNDSGMRDGGSQPPDDPHDDDPRDEPSEPVEDDPVPDMDAGAEADEDAGTEESPAPDPCRPEALITEDVVLSLDARSGVVRDTEGRVQQWNDRSSQAHVAGAVGAPAVWPIFVEQAEADHPAVQFGQVAGSVRRLIVPDHASLQFGTGHFALIAVVRFRNSTSDPHPDMQYGSIYQKACSNCAGYVGPYLFAGDPWPAYAGTGPANSAFLFELAAHQSYAARSSLSGFNDDRVHVVVAQRVGIELIVDVDGSPYAAAIVGSTLDVSTPGVPLAIGAHGTVDVQALDGEIFELWAMVGTSGHASLVRECMLSKYGFR